MKRRFTLCLMLALTVMMMLVSCTQTKRALLEANIRQTQKELPVSLSPEFSLSGIGIEDDFLVFTYETVENTIQVEAFASMLSAETVVTSLQSSEDTKKMMDLVADAEMGIKCRVVGKKSGKKLDAAEISPTLVRQICKEGLQPSSSLSSDPVDSYLMSQAAVVRSSCPLKVDLVTEMTDCSYDGKTFQYNYTILESSDFTIDALIEAKDSFEQQIRAGMTNSNNASAVAFASRCKEKKVKLLYHYVGSVTGKTMEIEIDSQTL